MTLLKKKQNRKNTLTRNKSERNVHPHEIFSVDVAEFYRPSRNDIYDKNLYYDSNFQD